MLRFVQIDEDFTPRDEEGAMTLNRFYRRIRRRPHVELLLTLLPTVLDQSLFLDPLRSAKRRRTN